MSDSMSQIVGAFAFQGEVIDCCKHGSGHINTTYLVRTRDGQDTYRYILQKINTGVFPNVEQLMENIVRVTEFLREKIVRCGGDPVRESVNLIRTRSGPYYHRECNDYYRAYLYVQNSVSYDAVENPELFRKSGEAFGRFQRLLEDYPAHTLHETIVNFHNTRARYQTFLQALKRNRSGRADQAADEIAFIKARAHEMGRLVDLVEQGRLPMRVTHNDTKLNNVLFDRETNDCVCIVDLDTVMPGLALYDFGDSIRFGANTAAEDEPDLDKVTIDLDYFQAYTEGFLAEAGESLTREELEHLAFSAKLMTLECGMRFLTDFIDGDTYFGAAYPDHNLVRARNQLKLVADMECQMDEMEQIVSSCLVTEAR
ncbi:MAG: aminoglycoside phosphotransferase family protein [Clostridiales bacterium]|nr:aminoglycoside phosphotransferase family protein [Clostridiales bacterium]